MEKKQEILQNIMDNYQHLEQSIVGQLFLEHSLHGTTIGTLREDIWEQLFMMILPKKFKIEHSVFIIDANEGISREVDLAVIDETYTPYIFRYGKLKFIPIEAVAVVVECKSKQTDMDNLKQWVESINNLKTQNESIARMAGKICIGPSITQKATRPIKILCSLEGDLSDMKENEQLELFDFLLLAKEGKDKQLGSIHIKISNQQSNLYDWYYSMNFVDDMEKHKISIEEEYLKGIQLDSYKVYDKKHSEQSLLSFNFILNQLLMLINNPLIFPHKKYVDMFNRLGE